MARAGGGDVSSAATWRTTSIPQTQAFHPVVEEGDMSARHQCNNKLAETVTNPVSQCELDELHLCGQLGNFQQKFLFWFSCCLFSVGELDVHAFLFQWLSHDEKK